MNKLFYTQHFVHIYLINITFKVRGGGGCNCKVYLFIHCVDIYLSKDIYSIRSAKSSLFGQFRIKLSVSVSVRVKCC